jgi:hypothetical protein
LSTLSFLIGLALPNCDDKSVVRPNNRFAVNCNQLGSTKCSIKPYQEQSSVAAIPQGVAEGLYNRLDLLLGQSLRLPLWSTIRAPNPAQRQADEFGLTRVCYIFAGMRPTDSHEASGEGRDRELASVPSQVSSHLTGNGRQRSAVS